MWQLALRTQQEICEATVQRNVITFNALASTCVVRGNWKPALALVSGGHTIWLDLDDVSYNTVISACEKSMTWLKAVHLLAVMHLSTNMRADVISQSATITCATEHEWTSTLALLGSLCMLVQPDAISLCAALCALEKAVCWQLALNTLGSLAGFPL
eukprot:g26136.t1